MGLCFEADSTAGSEAALAFATWSNEGKRRTTVFTADPQEPSAVLDKVMCIPHAAIVHLPWFAGWEAYVGAAC